MQSRRGHDQVPGGPGAIHGGSEAKRSAKETKEEIQDQKQEVEEDTDISSDEGLPIYPDFEYEVNYKKTTTAIKYFFEVNLIESFILTITH